MQSKTLRDRLSDAGWYLSSLTLFVTLWEAAWYVGWLNPAILPPPHIFLGDIEQQVQNFRSAEMVGVEAGSSFLALAATVLATCTRVIVGLSLGFILSVAIGVLIHYFGIFGKLTLPTITMLAPISPIAWLPIAIGVFGIGNGPAIFLVFITVFFIIVISTIADLSSVKKTYIEVAKVMGANKFQLYSRVLLPAILPGLFLTLRLNLFAAWMMVLVAEAAGVGSGLGMVINLARNTANASLVFFTIILIGIIAFIFDAVLRVVQNNALYWIPQERRHMAAR